MDLELLILRYAEAVGTQNASKKNKKIRDFVKQLMLNTLDELKIKETNIFSKELMSKVNEKIEFVKNRYKD